MKTNTELTKDFKNRLEIELRKVINTPVAQLKREAKAKKSTEKFLKDWYRDNPNANRS